jgi:putative ABC transport system permease protein
MTPDAMAMGSGPPNIPLIQLAVYAVLVLLLVILLLTMMAVATLPVFFAALGLMDAGLRAVQNDPDPIGKTAKVGGLVFRSLRRNLLRTALTYVALFVLTGMLTFLYNLLSSVESLTKEKEGSQLVIMTDKFGIPSMLPPGYVAQVKGMMRDETVLPKELQPDDVDKNFMTWSFVGASLDPAKMTKENSMFLFAIDPDVVPNGMMSEQGLNKDDLGEDGWAALLAGIAEVKKDKRNVVIGADRLELIGKKVGDQIKLYSTNYKDVEFECKIVAAFPSGSRMGMNAAMRFDYLTAKLDDYKAKKGTDHPNASRCVNLIWVRLPSKASTEKLASEVNKSSKFSAPAVKMEAFSSAIGSFLEPFKDILWGLKVIVMPAIVAIMCLVIGITITIGVRERWTEMAVMKVLGFQPWQVMTMIVSEAVLIGLFGGMLSTWCVYFLPKLISWANKAAGGKFTFFDNFKMEWVILVLGPLLGMAVGVIGAALPSWNARKVKVSEVFAQVA